MAVDAKRTADDDNDSTASDDDGVPVPDGGWAWIVAFSCLLINIIYDGCSYSFGIFFVNFLDYFGDTKRSTALIGALFFSVPLLMGPFASAVVNKFGYRMGTMIGGVITAVGFGLSSCATATWQLCLTYGLLAGVGMSIPYLTASVAVTSYFKKRLALASGIAESGAGLGTVIFAPFTEWLISKYGWRGSLLILSGVVLNTCVCGALIYPYFTKNSNNCKTCSSKILSPKRLCIRLLVSVRDYMTKLKLLVCLPFVVFTASSFIMYFWYDVPYVFTVDRAIELGTKSSKAAWLLTIIGIVHTPGNWIYGYFGDLESVNRQLLYGVSLVLCGGSMFLVPLCFSYWSMALTAIGFGWFTSAQEALTPVILSDMFGQKAVNVAFGVIMFLEGIANLIGPFIAGMLCDVTGTFDATFIVSGVCVSAGGALCTLYTCRSLAQGDKRRKQSEIPEDGLELSEHDLGSTELLQG